MNLVEKLLALDNGEIEEIPTKTVISKRLTALFGEETKVTLQAVHPESYQEMAAELYDDEGNAQIEKSYSVNARIAAAGIVEPSLKDADLMKKLGVASPADAAKKLFKGEVNAIADIIADLTGYTGIKESDEAIKN